MHGDTTELRSSYYPPRAGLSASLGNGWRRFQTRCASLVPEIHAPVPWRQAVLAWLVPGQGFRVHGRGWLGWLVMAGWILGGISAAVLSDTPRTRILLFEFDPFFAAAGWMAGMHAMSASYFAQRWWGWESPGRRMLLSIAISGLFLLAVYMPLAQALAAVRGDGWQSGTVLVEGASGLRTPPRGD